MKQDTTKGKEAQGVCWESLEGVVRERIQGWLQDLLEAEVTEFLGRVKYERRETGEADSGGYRYGYGKARQVGLTCGSVTVRRPRVRGVEETLESRGLPLFAKRTRAVAELLPQLYLHGLGVRGFRPGPAGAIGRGGSAVASDNSAAEGGGQGEYAAWQQRRLDGLEVVYVWADGVYIKAGLDKDKSCLLVLVGALADGRKVVLGLESGHRESKESWARLRSLRDRGLTCPKAVVGDGALGLWGALREVFPTATEQRCWNHRMVNVLDRIKQKDQETGKRLLRQIAYAPSRAQAETAQRTFQGGSQARGYPQASALLDEDWERMVAFLAFPKEHWGHLRTTNPVESPFAALRLRTEAAKRFKKVENATAVVWKLLLVAEQRFRRLNAPGLLAAVWQGVVFVDGVKIETGKETAPKGSQTAA